MPYIDEAFAEDFRKDIRQPSASDSGTRLATGKAHK